MRWSSHIASLKPWACARLMSYMTEVPTALMRRSTWAALSANPPLPQIPMTPILSRSRKGRVPRKSTAALKSSVKISGDELRRGSPPLSPL